MTSAQYPVERIDGPRGRGAAVYGIGYLEKAPSDRNQGGVGHHVGVVEHCSALNISANKKADKTAFELLVCWDCLGIHDYFRAIPKIVERKLSKNFAHFLPHRTVASLTTQGVHSTPERVCFASGICKQLQEFVYSPEFYGHQNVDSGSILTQNLSFLQISFDFNVSAIRNATVSRVDAYDLRLVCSLSDSRRSES